MRRPGEFADPARRWLRPAAGPIWRIALISGGVLSALDLAVPLPLPPSAALVLMVGLSGIVWSERLTTRLTALAVLASLLTGLVGVWRSTGAPAQLTVRLGITLLILSVGSIVSWWVRRATPTQPTSALKQSGLGQAGRGRAGELELPAGLLERASSVLAQLCGAAEMSLTRVENVAEAVAQLGTAAASPRPARWRQLFMPPSTLPPLAGRGQAARPQSVWLGQGGQAYVKFHHPGQGEALVSLRRPRVPLGFIEDAARVLQLQLERAALLEEVRTHRELLRDLVYAFSHDLRTPITANLLSAQAALAGAFGPLPEALREVLHGGLESSRGLLAISDQLMLLAEYESGGPSGDESAVVDLEPVVRSVVSDLLLRAQGRQLDFELTLDALCVRGQRYDLRRAVQNLLDNAVKFSPPGLSIGVQLRREDAWAVLEVRDAGPGVAAAQQAQLFERFRASAAGSGSGIGLYLTRRIVERHGGVAAYARQGGHTVFSLRLPLVQRSTLPA